MNQAVIGGLFIAIFYKISKNNPNKRTLYLKPPLVFKNCLSSRMGLRIYDGKPSKFEEVFMNKNEELQSYSYSLYCELAGSLSLDNFSRSNMFPLQNHQNSVAKIKLADRKGLELRVNLTKFEDGNHFFAFYVPQLIVNNTLNPVAFYHYSKGQEIMIPGQDFNKTILPSNKTKKILIGLGNQKSRSFKIDSVGINDIIELLGDRNPAGHSAKYQYTLDVQVAKILKNEMIFTKIVIIAPRFLIINNSDTDILIAQDGVLEYGLLVKSGTRLPFHWADKSLRELVRIKGKSEE